MGASDREAGEESCLREAQGRPATSPPGIAERGLSHRLMKLRRHPLRPGAILGAATLGQVSGDAHILMTTAIPNLCLRNSGLHAKLRRSNPYLLLV
jgi:hypothetical protein